MEIYLLLTVSHDELTTIIREAVKESLAGNKQAEATQYFYSLRELASFLKCSTFTELKLKNSGKIRFTQYGKKCMFSSAEVLEDLACKKLWFRKL